MSAPGGPRAQRSREMDHSTTVGAEVWMFTDERLDRAVADQQEDVRGAHEALIEGYPRRVGARPDLTGNTQEIQIPPHMPGHSTGADQQIARCMFHKNERFLARPPGVLGGSGGRDGRKRRAELRSVAGATRSLRGEFSWNAVLFGLARSYINDVPSSLQGKRSTVEPASSGTTREIHERLEAV